MISRKKSRTLGRRRWAAWGFLCAALAWAQMNTGEIGGSVQDPSGAVLPGAAISAEQLGTGQTFRTVSNSAGEYLFPQLPSGTYTLRAGAPNFKQTVLAKVEIHAGDR